MGTYHRMYSRTYKALLYGYIIYSMYEYLQYGDGGTVVDT